MSAEAAEGLAELVQLVAEGGRIEIEVYPDGSAHTDVRVTAWGSGVRACAGGLDVWMSIRDALREVREGEIRPASEGER